MANNVFIFSGLSTRAATRAAAGPTTRARRSRSVDNGRVIAPPPTVADAAYERLRALVLGGDVAPGARLGQVELAERLGISRTPVREALRRLSGEGLVDFHPNRGFRVADLGLDAVLRRLEVRAILEPGIARLAAERHADRDGLRQSIARESRARTATAAHDASRDFHVALARATGNDELVRTLESLWIVEVGRRLLSRRSATEAWVPPDIADHEAITAAVEDGDGERAATLMAAHIDAALHHWRT
jgi:DNA-binding GntR family transcriptional regulator